MTGLVAGSYTIGAMKAGYTIAGGFTNPVTVGPNASAINFTGTQTTYSIGGTVTEAGVGLPGVVVSDGTRSATTDSLGNYSIVAVPDGMYTLTPSKPGYTFAPATLGVAVSGANLAGKNFAGTSVNTAPTISNIADRTITEDANTGLIAFTIGDSETAAGSLTVVGSSSNTTLVPNANIVFGGGGANRTVTVTPAANQNGTATISVAVSDGALSATDTFILTVSAVNDTPTISNIADQSTPMNTATGAIAFTVGDVETAAASLTVTGSSSNTALVPNANIVFGGSGSNRTVTVMPVAGQAGSATITVTVSDGGLAASDTFVLSVANTPPTISDIANRTVNEDTSTGAVSFTVGDAQTAAASLTVSGSSSNTTLVPNANIVFGGSGANRTITATPAANQFGSATITVTVSDGSLSASDAFVLTVASVNDVPVANNQSVSTMKRKPVAITLVAVDVETAVLAYTVVTAPTRGTLTGTAPNLIYTPANGTTGADSFTYRASDGTANSNTATVSINVTKTAPTLTSALTITPNPALIGETVSFPAAASDTDGDLLTYVCDFGDGNIGTGTNATHVYTVAGIYTAALTVTDEDGQSIIGSASVTVNTPAGGGGGGGTAPGVKTPMSVTKLVGKVSFANPGRDSCSLAGTIPDLPAKFDPAGAVVSVNVGGAVASFTLNTKGKGISEEGSISLILKPSARNKETGKVEFLGGPVNFKLQLKNGAWADDWADEGIDPTADAAGKSLSMTADITLNGKIYTSTLSATYSGKAGKGGTFK
jgi:PKD repeat protein